MAITNVPTFADGEIPAAAKLNQLGAAVTTKFAGAISGGDLAWPLTAQGNLDMAGFSVLSVKRFWNFYNADEYDTLQEAIDAAESTSGGTVIIPPNTTTAKFQVDGLTVTSGNIAIIGSGPTSTISVTSGASSTYLLRTAASLSNFLFANLNIDGSTNATAGQHGLVFQQATNVHIDNVIFNDCTGDAVRVVNDGTGGNQCTDVFISNCRFINGDAGHIFTDDVDGLYISKCRFRNPTTDCVEGVPTDASSKMRSIQVFDCRMSNCARAVHIVGASDTANDLWRLVEIERNEIFTATGIAITVGAATARVKYGYVKNNKIITTTTDAINVLLAGGEVSNNNTPDAGADALSILTSDSLVVRGNKFLNATANGIDATGATNCYVVENILYSFGAAAEAIVTSAATTGCVFANNYGVPNTGHSEGASMYTAVTHTGTLTATPKFEHTVQAGTFVVPGQAIRITAVGGKSGNGDVGIQVRLDDVSIAAAASFTTAIDDWWIEVIIYCNGPANQAVVRRSGQDTAGVGMARGTTTVDFTADVVIDVAHVLTDASGTSSMNNVFVEYLNLDTDNEI